MAENRTTPEAEFVKTINAKVSAELAKLNIVLSGREHDTAAIDYRPSVLNAEVNQLHLRATGQQMKLLRTRPQISEQQLQTYAANIKETAVVDDFYAVLKDAEAALLDAKGKPSKTVNPETVAKSLLVAAKTLTGDSHERATMLGYQMRAIGAARTGGRAGFAKTAMPLIRDEIYRTGGKQSALWDERAPIASEMQKSRDFAETERSYGQTADKLNQYKKTTAAVRGVWADALAAESMAPEGQGTPGLDAVHPSTISSTEGFDKYVDQISKAAEPTLQIAQSAAQRGLSRGTRTIGI